MPKYKFSEIAYNINQKKIPEPGEEKMYIGLEHLDSGSLKVRRWGSEVPITGEKLVMKKGDILFGRRNTYLRRASIAPHDGIFSAHGMIFRPNTEVIDPDYFPFFISSDYFMNAAIRISVGSLSPTVNWKTLKELEFDIPDLDSQRKSAELLTAANKLKESYEALLEQTDQLVKSQFIEMFDKSSKEVLLSDYVWFQEGPGVRSKDFTDNGVILLTGSNINDNQISFGYNSDRHISEELANGKYNHFLCDKDDILVVSSAIDPKRFDSKVVTVNVDKEYCLNTGIIRFKPNLKFLTRSYFKEFLKSEYFKQQVSVNLAGICQMHFGPSHLKKMALLLPDSIDLQNEFESIVKQSDKSKFEIKKSIENISDLIKSLLQQDFNI